MTINWALSIISRMRWPAFSWKERSPWSAKKGGRGLALCAWSRWNERLDPARLMQDLKTRGKSAAYLPDTATIVEHVGREVSGGDVVCVFSNGGFGNIHAKLLERLRRV